MAALQEELFHWRPQSFMNCLTFASEQKDEDMAWNKPALAASLVLNKRCACLLTLFCIAVWSHGCGYAKGRPYATEGRIFSSRLVGTIEKGMTKDKILGVLGEPLERSAAEDGREKWRYYAVHRQDEEIVFLGRTIRRVPYYIVENEVIITFYEGVVEDVYSRENNLDPNRSP